MHIKHSVRVAIGLLVTQLGCSGHPLDRDPGEDASGAHDSRAVLDAAMRSDDAALAALDGATEDLPRGPDWTGATEEVVDAALSQEQSDGGLGCDTTPYADRLRVCFSSQELRDGGVENAVLLDPATSLGTPAAPHCPAIADYHWKELRGEDCVYVPLCGPELVKVASEFSCCYDVRSVCIVL